MQFSQPQPNALAAILGTAAPQTDTAYNSAPQGAGISRDQMEAAARSRGYRSYNDMIYSMQNRLPPPKVPGSTTTAAPSGHGLINALQAIWADPHKALADAFAWHPASTLGRVNAAFDKINQGN